MFSACCESLASNHLTVAALSFPDITKRIQAEIDSVVGRDRLPTFHDEPSLPFLGAFIKEVTRRVSLLIRYLFPVLALTFICERWRPVAPLAVPHATTRSDVYEGYDIPKGAAVWGNIEYVVFLSVFSHLLS